MTLTLEQVDARRTGLGGSDMAVAAGISKWKTPYELWLEKRGLAPAFEGNEFTKWGHYLEPAIIQEYAERTGREVTRPEGTLRHPSLPFLLCHPDGITKDARLVEAKNTRYADGWGEPGTDDVPHEYLVQVQHNMRVASAASGFAILVADLPVLIQGSDFRIYTVHADTELQDALAAKAAEFWAMVENGTPPAPRNVEDARRRYARSREAAIEGDALVRDSISALVAYEETKKRLDESIDEAKARVLAFMGEHDTLTLGGRTVATWKSAKGARRVDMDALRASHPELVEEFTRTGEATRRFLLKKGT